MNWESDTGLKLRMVLALTVVLALPFGFAYTFVVLLNAVGTEVLEFVTRRPWNGEFYLDTGVLVGAVAVGFLVQVVVGKRFALRSVGARTVDADDYPELHAAVTRLAAQLDLPTPAVAVSPSAVPNAFTVGRSPDSATVVVTDGLLDELDDDELEAVLAHELAHVNNRDATVMTLAYFLPTLTYFVASGAYFVLDAVFAVRGNGRYADEADVKWVAVALAVVTASAMVTLSVSVAFWVGSVLVFRVLARYREYAADRGAAVLTGKPGALASALRTLDDGMTDVPDDDLREQDGGLEALYVAPIDAGQFDDDRALVSCDLFPQTHPPADERIDRLRDIAADLESR